ncbi:hypothetical protein SAMN05192534_101452 [Alteribacillus persepolensis]|uniref:Sporulation lipoprotein YhcN/YlaJ (Spore_YhcN_YlaJ) n=1 Tax=Alteribacillus persepolensis TaxID=568899 RepID=A0A1G7ZAS7_9BACI|nr:hypothetical protein [Alteribacillus persepolensis]SDH05210.1 hypothetical protein SAMN05192534_101452 [Alteribacillus persepolensis]
MYKFFLLLISVILIAGCTDTNQPEEQGADTRVTPEPNSYEQKKATPKDPELHEAAAAYGDYLKYFHRSLRQVHEEVKRNDINEYWVEKQLEDMIRQTEETAEQAPEAFAPLKEVQQSTSYELKMAKSNADNCFHSRSGCDTMQTHLNNLYHVDKIMDETYKDVLFDHGI